MPITKFLNHIQNNKRYSQHTVTAYRNDLSQLEAFLKSEYEIDLLQANSNMLRSWLVAFMEEKILPKTINRKISSIKSFYNFQLRENKIEKLPTIKLISPKVSKALPSVIKLKEMDSLLNDFNFENSLKGKRDELMLELFYSCGIRLSELINSRTSDLNLEEGSLKVLGKRNKERIVPLHRVVVDKLRAYLIERNEVFSEVFLFLTDSGKKMYPKFVYRKVIYYLGQVSTSKKKSPHVLRHTFATHMLDNGADLNSIKEILGHANLSATEVYTHNSIEKLKKSYNQAHPRA